jgi:hypothetical protein
VVVELTQVFKDTRRISKVTVRSDNNFRYSDMFSLGSFLREALSPMSIVRQGLQISNPLSSQFGQTEPKNHDLQHVDKYEIELLRLVGIEYNKWRDCFWGLKKIAAIFKAGFF